MLNPAGVVVAAVVGAVLLGGCGHGHHRHDHDSPVGEPGDPKGAARTIEVQMGDNMRFAPSLIQVKQGETIRFVVRNNGQVKHEMVLGTMAALREHAEMMKKHPEMEHDEPNQALADPGKTAQIVWRFTKAGEFDFGCLQPGHFEAGMLGKIRVEPK